jgi:hypothetical protein
MLFLSDFDDNWISAQVFEEYPEVKFNENPSCGSRVSCRLTDGRTDKTKPVVAFPNF